MIDSSQEIAIVTGASSQIGQAIVEKLLASEISVIALIHKTSLPEKHKNLISLTCDLNNRKSVTSIFSKIRKISSKIDHLILGAATIDDKNFLELTYNDIDRIYGTNLFSQYIILKETFKLMEKALKGNIIYLSSIGVKYAGSDRSLLYSSSKAAGEAIIRSISKFGAEKGIRANSVRIGVIKSKIHANKNMEKRISLIPMKRAGKVAEVAELVYYLCKQESEFISGQEIAISGGE